jgi:hypothetical protein
MRKRWYLWLVTPFGTVMYWRFQSWVSGEVGNFMNRYLTRQIPHPIIVLVGLFLLTVVVFIGWAYFETKHQQHEIIDGEIYRIAACPRTVSWDLVRDVFRLQGHEDEAKVDTDVLIEMYLVNRSEKKSKYIRDLNLSVEVGGHRIALKLQGDLEGADFADNRYEYGLKQGGLGSPCEAIKKLFPSLPFELAPTQPIEGWVRFLAKEINPDNIDSKTWKISVLDSVGREYFLTRAATSREPKGEVSLRRLQH